MAGEETAAVRSGRPIQVVQINEYTTFKPSGASEQHRSRRCSHLRPIDLDD